MINKTDLEVSNLSYVNKDFTKVYAEILDLANKLSSKWQPSSSNESDPGVVLLKFLAFAVDKLNYNVDKATLENKMPSATQESSMRDLCESNGYNPKYYRAATTNVSVMYSGDIEGNKTFTLPAFETEFEDAESSIIYTLIKPITVYAKNIEVSGLAIQGKKKDLTSISGTDTVIKLADLNDNNRIYIPDIQVAENGIYILALDNTTLPWTKVDNLNVIEPGKQVYKFGFDSAMGLPYIEFPKDIAALIGSGLKISYIVTDGAEGNISARYLAQRVNSAAILYDNTDEQVILEDDEGNKLLGVSNAAASINGANPETINEAFNSFKKVVGTFETLVTCKDYANAIYNILTEDDTALVSNVQVGDRRNDINYANNVVTYNEYGLTRESNIVRDITPFDLCLYPLKPIKYTYNIKTYKESFTPLATTEEVEESIKDLKLASHNYKQLENDDIYAYKNYYKLIAKITTNYKVNTFEQAEIKLNIYDALYRNFNARKLDYGCEIPYESILAVIENADTRIKNVSLDEPDIYTKVLLKSGEEKLLIDPTSVANCDYYLDLLAKNIVSGKISLFEYDNNFSFDFGQSVSANKDEFVVTADDDLTITEDNIGDILSITISTNENTFEITKILDSTHFAMRRVSGTDTLPNDGALTCDDPEYTITYVAYYITNILYGHKTAAVTGYPSLKKHYGIKNISTEVKFPTVEDGDGAHILGNRALLENQVIQLIAPNLTDEVIYPYGINYAWIPGTDGVSIPKNTEYKLIAQDKLIVQYTDEHDQNIVRIYTASTVTDENGRIIKSHEDVVADGGNIFKTNFDVAPTATRDGTPTKEITIAGVLYKLYTIATNDQIAVRKFVRAIITDTNLECYWVTNRPNNALFTAADVHGVVAHKYDPSIQYYSDQACTQPATPTSAEDIASGTYYIKATEVILAENEYFIYTNATETSLAMVGSGTKLTYYGVITNFDAWKISSDEGPTLEDINNSGLAAFKDYPWVHKNFSKNNLEIQEMQLLTLTAGDVIDGVIIDESEGAGVDCVNNTFKKVATTSAVKYQLFGEAAMTDLPSFSIDSCFWQIRSRLDLNAGPEVKQQLKTNETITLDVITDIVYNAERSVGGAIELDYITVPCTITEDTSLATYFNFNALLQQVGGVGLDMATIDTNGDEGYELEMYVYDYETPTYKIISNDDTVDVEIERGSSGYVSIPFATYKEDTVSTYTNLKLIRLDNEKQLIMFYYNHDKVDNTEASVVKLTPVGGKLGEYGKTLSTSAYTLHKGVNVIEVGAGVSAIKLQVTYTDTAKRKLESLAISTLTNIYGYLPELFPVELFPTPAAYIAALENKIKVYGQVGTGASARNIFYYNAPIDNSYALEVKDLTSALALFDSNNIANKFTICQIDFAKENINIDIARTSRV